MAPLLGYNGYIGTGEESTWGTAVSRSAWIQRVSSSLQRTVTRQPIRSLTGPNGPLLRGVFQSSEDVAGNVVFIPDYANKVFAHFLKHAAGQVNTTGSGPYTHTFTPLATLPAGLTIDIGNVSAYEVFEGCKVASLEFAVSAGGLAQVTAALIGQTSGGFTTPNSSPPTVPALTYPIHHGQAGTAIIAGNTYRLKSFKLAINNALARRPALGLQVTDEPYSTAERTYMAMVELELINEVLIGDYTGGGTADMIIAFTDSPRSLTFTLKDAVIMNAVYNNNQVGPQTLSLTLQGFDDGTDKGLSIALVNANSSAV